LEILQQLAEELKIRKTQVDSTVALIDQGATIPFIARYRKEVTGGLDDGQLRALHERLQYLRNLEKRKAEVRAAIEAQDKLTPELEQAIERAVQLVALEDLYRPYRPKRKTRASVARARGLEPLAVALLAQSPQMPAPLELAQSYVSQENDLPDAAAAIAGAKDIIAEMISDEAGVRGGLRAFLLRSGVLCVRAANPQAESVYEMYYEFEEPCHKLPGHRILAINRGEKEAFLKVALQAEAANCLQFALDWLLKGPSPARELLVEAAQDALSRLIMPSLENEVRGILTDRAQESAIRLFSENLHQLLMQPPLKERVVLGLDPAYRTGCKIAVVDATGKVLDTTVIYPTPPQSKVQEAKKTLHALIEKHGVSVISIGNGTASGESEHFVAQLIQESGLPLSYMVVSESGASVYSASKLAAEEFPEFDVSLRSAVSIARRIQDPLAELVKIDPKAIGVGQYQHDMPPARLDESLGGVVENCVNTVGVDLNTASHSLLSYVAGINGTVAKNIVKYREENGSFTSRAQLKKVPRLGGKAFEQCAGFLRLKGAKTLLDNTAVHPESYAAAEGLLKACGFALADVETGKIAELKQRIKQKGAAQLAETLGVGVPTLNDIVDELLKPGRDPRDNLPLPILRTGVLSIEDLEADMVLEGTVRNVIDFGAFVDIGVHQDGLVHISHLSKSYVKHPLDVVKVGEIVRVKVLGVDLKKKRISLSMKEL
jgi:Transcriptional accessory protein